MRPRTDAAEARPHAPDATGLSCSRMRHSPILAIQGDRPMTGKARFIFPVLMAGIMAFLMTALVTWLNLGLPADFVRHWLAAFAVAWPCAAAAAFIAIPVARRATGLVIRVIGE
jgi:hypothetical protein